MRKYNSRSEYFKDNSNNDAERRSNNDSRMIDESSLRGGASRSTNHSDRANDFDRETSLRSERYRENHSSLGITNKPTDLETYSSKESIINHKISQLTKKLNIAIIILIALIVIVFLILFLIG